MSEQKLDTNLHVRIEGELHEEAKAQAEKRRLPLSYFVRELLRAWLGEIEYPPQTNAGK